jgi:hypothetical protein
MRKNMTEKEKINYHPRLSQYTVKEAQSAIEAIQLLIKIRDRCRLLGLIKW